MNFSKVSIIIPNWNGNEKIIRCIGSVMDLDYPSYELIVIDNHSTDGSLEKIKEMFKRKKAKDKEFRVIENSENLGCVKAINQGFSASKNPYILRLDDDVVLGKDLLKKLMEVISKDPKIGVLIPKVYYYSQKDVLCNIGFSINKISGKTNAPGLNKKDIGQFDNQREVDFVPGAVLLTKKEVIEKAGKVNEDFFVYYEDADWCSKVREAGYKIVYTPITKAWHDCKSHSDLSPFRIYHYTRSKIFFMKRNNGFFQKTLFLLFFTFVYTPVTLLKFAFKKDFSLIPSYLKGLKEGLFYGVR